MSAKLTELEAKELAAVLVSNAQAEAESNEPIFLYTITLTGFAYPITTQATAARADANRMRGFWEIGSTRYTIASIEQGERIL